MKKQVKKWMRPVLFSLGGAAVGYLYYRFFGCTSGTCAITSSPVNSMLYVGLIGLLLSGAFKKGCSSSCNM